MATTKTFFFLSKLVLDHVCYTVLQTQRIQISVNFRRPYYKSWWPQVVFQPQGWNTLVNVYFLHHLLRLLCLRVMTSVSLQWCKQSAEMGFDRSDVWKCPVGFGNDSVSLKKKKKIRFQPLGCSVNVWWPYFLRVTVCLATQPSDSSDLLIHVETQCFPLRKNLQPSAPHGLSEAAQMTASE